MGNGLLTCSCCNQIGACALLYGWPCFQKISGQFDCIFVQGPTKRNFHSVWRKSFLQCEFTCSSWITHKVGHIKSSWWFYCWNIMSSIQCGSNQTKVPLKQHFLVSRMDKGRTWEDACNDTCIFKTTNWRLIVIAIV